MLTDPQTITINAVPKTLNRVSSNGTSSLYKTDDESLTFTVSHRETGKPLGVGGVSTLRTNRTIRLDTRTVAPNPLTTANEYKVSSISFVINEPEYGFDDTVLDQQIQGLKGWLTTANVLKVLTDQS